MVRTLPGQGTKILQATGMAKQNKTKNNPISKRQRVKIEMFSYLKLFEYMHGIQDVQGTTKKYGKVTF